MELQLLTEDEDAAAPLYELPHDVPGDDAGCADAVDEADFASVFGAELEYADNAVWGVDPAPAGVEVGGVWEAGDFEVGHGVEVDARGGDGGGEGPGGGAEEEVDAGDGGDGGAEEGAVEGVAEEGEGGGHCECWGGKWGTVGFLCEMVSCNMALLRLGLGQGPILIGDKG